MSIIETRPTDIPLIVGIALQDIYHDPEKMEIQGRRNDYAPGSQEVFEKAYQFSRETEILAHNNRLNRLWVLQIVGEVENIPTRDGRLADLECNSPQIAIQSMHPIFPLQGSDSLFFCRKNVEAPLNADDDFIAAIEQLNPSHIYLHGLYLDQAVQKTAMHLRQNADFPVTILIDLTLPFRGKNNPLEAERSRKDVLSVLECWRVKTLDSSEFLSQFGYQHEDPAPQFG